MPKGRVFHPEQYIGQKYGRLKVRQFLRLKQSGMKFRHAIFLCDCDCGRQSEVSIYNLRSKNTTSCGCLRTEMHTRHGLCHSPEYASWEHMIDRVSSETPRIARNYKNRGIGVCSEWSEEGGFESFLAHIGPKPSPKHSIDRIDNSRGYEPGNVRWATHKEQARNTRRNRIVEIDGCRMTLAEACERLGLNYMRVFQRLRRGWDQSRALEISTT